jgi:putative nucleotidyltransferase with HDIG domain
MAKAAKNSAVARQVELIIRQLDSLSTLPEVAAEFLAKLAAGPVDDSALTEIIESDPALTAKIFSLAYKEGITFTDNRPSVAEAVAKLPTPMVRDAVMSVKVFAAFEPDYDPDSRRTIPRKQLALHALGVACCAKDIAQLVLPATDRHLAFPAGLLHDIGKLAMDEAMPKSFERLIQEAKTQNSSICRIEQKHLGLDHAVIGKRLAEKWNLPPRIVFAVWLHHSDPDIISENMPAASLAAIVHLADIIVRQCNIGMSGSFDSPASISQITESLSLSTEQIEQIRHRLPGTVSQRSELLGLETPGGPAAYCELISETAAKLAHDGSELTAVNRRLAMSSAHMDFVNEFLLSVNPNMAPIDAAAAFARGWQRHYQTGPVCVYLQPPGDEKFLEAAVIDDSGRINTQLIKPGAGAAPVPEQLQTKFAILDAGGYMNWFLEQIECEFDVSRAKIAPLLVGGRPIGGIIFEQRVPADPALQSALFGTSASVAAAIIALASAHRRQGRLAERFAQFLGAVKETRDQVAAAKSLIGIAEMAAGAAHELNNPLAVISGRVQLLYDAETDKSKKQMLKQIQARAEEISQIFSDLMSFARPEAPAPKMISVRALLDAAVRKTADERKLKALKVPFNAIDALAGVYIDSDQVTTAIANILSNAMDSYKTGRGPIRIDGTCDQTEGFAAFQIIDSGCGMDAQTLTRAVQPFFSARPAGRKLGMGLAHARRLLQLNNGSIHLTSEPGRGTIVTIKLPAGPSDG